MESLTENDQLEMDNEKKETNLNFPNLLTLRLGISVALRHDALANKQVLNLQAGLKTAPN